MQLKSLSYGHFPLNLLGMSAPETLGAHVGPHPPVPAECAGQDPQTGETARIRHPRWPASAPGPPGRRPMAGAA